MNSLKNIFVLLLSFLSITGVYAQDKLDSYLTEAARNNPGLRAKFSEYQAALEKVPQVGSLPDPQISFGYFIQPVETRVGPQRAKISASQMFPWFGTLGARKDVATEMAKAKYESFEEVKSRLFYDVRSTWYNLYVIQKSINITLENIDILNSFRRLSLIKVETGLASTVDVLRVEIEISDLENQLALLKDTYFSQQSMFNNLLNVDESRDINLPDTLKNIDISYDRQSILDSIRGNNHQVLQLEFAEASYQKQEIAARKAAAPQLMLGAEYMVTGKSSNPMVDAGESGKDAFVFPMIGISIPIYRKKYTAMVKEASLMQQSTNDQKADKVNILESTYEKANRDYQDAKRRIPLFYLQSDRANKAMNILQTSYQNDGKNFEEVLRMERQLLKYKLELEKARADKAAAIAFINYLMGR